MALIYLSYLCCLLFAASLSYAAETNLVALHKNSAKLSNKECLGCHKGVLKESTSNKKIKTVHRLHLESKKETPKKCTDCHQSIDLREGSAAALRKQVDPQLCNGCHDGNMKGAKVLFSKQEE